MYVSPHSLAPTRPFPTGNSPTPVDWQDNSRDILQFLLHYLPERASTHDLPVHLPALPAHIVQARRAHGFASRTLVGVAHSLGGTTL